MFGCDLFRVEFTHNFQFHSLPLGHLYHRPGIGRATPKNMSKRFKCIRLKLCYNHNKTSTPKQNTSFKEHRLRKNKYFEKILYDFAQVNSGHVPNAKSHGYVEKRRLICKFILSQEIEQVHALKCHSRNNSCRLFAISSAKLFNNNQMQRKIAGSIIAYQ